MRHLNFDLPEQQWRRVAAAAQQMWPDERLSNAEIVRRCMFLGVCTLPYLTADAARMFVAIYRDYQPPHDGASRLTTHDEAEGHPHAEVKSRS